MAAISLSTEPLASATAPARPTQSAPVAFKQSNARRSELLLRFTLLNLLALAMLGAAAWEGYVNTVLEADQTRLSVAIFAVFLIGLIISMRRAWQISQEIDAFTHPATQSPDSGTASQGALRLRLSQRIASVRHIANTLVLLGLIGTVLGFIIALSGVDPDTASDVNSIAPMVSVLIQGMSTALYTTLIGSILNLWLMANYQLLTGGTVKLMSLWLEQNDTNA